jgi:hypothetical protein
MAATDGALRPRLRAELLDRRLVGSWQLWQLVTEADGSDMAVRSCLRPQ